MSGDTFTLADIEAAVKQLRKDSVKPDADGKLWYCTRCWVVRGSKAEIEEHALVHRGEVAVVFRVDPETTEHDREWNLVDVNVPHSKRDPRELVWEAEFCVRENIEPLPYGLWGDEVPGDVLVGGKFLAFGRIESFRSGNPLDGYEDDCWFVVHRWRRLA